MVRTDRLDPAALSLLSYSPLQYMFDALGDARGLADIYANDASDPSCIFVLWGHNLFLGGEATEDAVNFLSGFVPEHAKKLCLMKVFYPEAWRDVLVKLFPGGKQAERSLYSAEGPSDAGSFENGRVHPITASLMNSKFSNKEMISDEVEGTYGSLEQFLETGFGFALVIDDTIAGFCTSEFQSSSACAVGIEVLEPYQRQGFAKKMTAAFLNEASARGLTVYWECWKNNTPSVKTALSCGFQKECDYPVIVVLNDDIRHGSSVCRTIKI